MNILIGADFVPTKDNEDLFISGNTKALIGEELLELFKLADYKVFNLELPLIKDGVPIPKCGPNLKARPETIQAYKALGVDLFTLANNHIRDYGVEGLFSTIKLLEENGISHSGAGANITEAQEPHIVQIDNKKIGFYMCCEHEFSIADAAAPGVNPFDPLESYDHVHSLKQQCDYVIVLYHGGKEHYRYPSPNLQRYCRKFIDKGADLVVCQHSHCIGCEEKYNDGTIVYGQGNFLFCSGTSEFWQTSLLIKITDDFNIEYIPLVKTDKGVCMADSKRTNEIIGLFNDRSKEITDEKLVRKLYDDFSDSMINYYLMNVSGLSDSILFKIINKLFAHKLTSLALRLKYSKKMLLSIQNQIECEANHELMLNGLKNIIERR